MEELHPFNGIRGTGNAFLSTATIACDGTGSRYNPTGTLQRQMVLQFNPAVQSALFVIVYLLESELEETHPPGSLGILCS